MPAYGTAARSLHPEAGEARMVAEVPGLEEPSTGSSVRRGPIPITARSTLTYKGLLSFRSSSADQLRQASGRLILGFSVKSHRSGCVQSVALCVRLAASAPWRGPGPATAELRKLVARKIAGPCSNHSLSTPVRSRTVSIFPCGGQR